jgi:glyoxylase-like metal-dependent hydrolase (beta-lactamase superfamily II)
MPSATAKRTTIMNAIAALLLALAALPLVAQATPPQQQGRGPMPSVALEEDALKRVSDHIWLIDSKGRAVVPNVAIVVGSRATLVVDTGMGTKSGELVMRDVQKVSKNPVLYLTATHFHPEHISGEPGFPSSRIFILPEAQKKEYDEHGEETLDRFRQMSPEVKGLLDGVKVHDPDITFDRELIIDLGGVTARMMWLGPAHTVGDNSIFVPEDSVLISGDIAQNKLVPNMPAATASATNWIVILDKFEALHPRIVLPDHGAIGDGSIIGQDRDFLAAVEARVKELKSKGTSVEDAQQILSAEFQAKYPDWENPRAIGNIVARFYSELP